MSIRPTPKSPQPVSGNPIRNFAFAAFGGLSSNANHNGRGEFTAQDREQFADAVVALYTSARQNDPEARQQAEATLKDFCSQSGMTEQETELHIATVGSAVNAIASMAKSQGRSY